MKKKYNTSLFIFRRDLRIQDNQALLKALTLSEHVITCFIFDPQQIGSANSYRSSNSIQFMLHSLTELAQEFRQRDGRLYFFAGHPEDVLRKIAAKISLGALFVSKDYTPFSTQRDKLMEKFCTKNNIDFYQVDDVLLHAPEHVTKKDGMFYSIFTPFYKKARLLPVAQPHKNTAKNYFTKKLIPEKNPATVLTGKNTKLFRHGGRKEALNILKSLHKYKEYLNTRDIPALPTTGLSAHLKFGTISVREVYYTIIEKLGKAHPLLRQLYWRDFFTHIAYHRPDVFGSAFYKQYNHLVWNKSEKDFEKWCTGTTGFPLVDAGMRQLNTTGYMHNRVRMVVASFLVKDLHIDWRKGEKYFAQQLVDYDPALNNGNWQWVASTGCDAQPYFRIFNPWLQQKKFDPEALYIKRWLPELKNIPVKDIHTWYKREKPLKQYPLAMLNHSAEAAYAIQLFKKANVHKIKE